MKNILIALVFIIVFVMSSLSQTNSQKTDSIAKIKKFSEFSYCGTELDIQTSRFAKVFKKYPTATAYFILYVHSQTDKETMENLLNNIKNKLKEKKISPKHFVIIEGGIRDFWTVEIFIVPKGADLPVPTPTQV